MAVGVGTDQGTKYLSRRIADLSELDKHGILMIDEIHSDGKVNLKGATGQILGFCASGTVSKTVLALMFKSSFGR
jgi:hypothetical protein